MDKKVSSVFAIMQNFASRDEWWKKACAEYLSADANMKAAYENKMCLIYDDYMESSDFGTLEDAVFLSAFA